jgi:single-strand DNA-binding protein
MNHAIVTFTGNLCADPERRQLPSGISVTNLRVASTERRLDKQNNQWYDGATTFFNVTCWNKLGERVASDLHKGDPVFVSGRLLERGYEKKDGSGRATYWEVEAVALGPDLNRTKVQVLGRQRVDAAPAATSSGASAALAEPAATADPWTADIPAEPAA